MEKFLDLAEDKSKALELSFGKRVLSNNDLVSRTEAVSPPQLAFPAGKSSSKYIAVSLDNDAPFPSFNFLSPILHWIQSDLQISAPAHHLTSDAPAIVNWIGPEPPPGSSTHLYVFLLYEQPENFESEGFGFAPGKPVGLWPRIRWNLSAWEKKASVDKPVAVGYFKSI